MTRDELLNEVKVRIGITGEYQNATVMGYIEDAIAYMRDAGLDEVTIESKKIVGAVARGVSDLLDHESFSAYFFQRVTQLAYKKGEDNE